MRKLAVVLLALVLFLGLAGLALAEGPSDNGIIEEQAPTGLKGSASLQWDNLFIADANLDTTANSYCLMAGWSWKVWHLYLSKPTGVEFAVSDLFINGDYYALSVDGAVVLTTPVTPLGGSVVSAGKVQLCLPAGWHVITVQDVAMTKKGYPVWMCPAAFNLSWTLDAQAPTVAISAPIAGAWYQADPAPAYTVSDNFANPQVSAQVTGADCERTLTVTAQDCSGNVSTATVTYYVDKTAPVVAISAPAHNGYYTSESVPAPAFTVSDDCDAAPAIAQMGYSTVEGIRVFTITATDRAGNVGSAQVVYTVDNTAPMISLNLGASMCYQAQPNPTDLFDAADNLDPQFQVSHAISGGPCQFTLTITAQDAAGNTATRAINYVVDNQSPVIQITSPLDGAVHNPENLPAGAFVANDDCDAAPLTIESGWSDVEGVHTFTVIATDCAGNSSTASASYTVDATPPAPANVIAAEAPGLGADPDQAGELTLLGVAEDNARLQVWVKGPGRVDFAYDGSTVVDGCGHWQYTFLFGDAAGLYTFKIGSRDLAGNWTWSDEFSLTLDPAVAIETIALQQGVEFAGAAYDGASDAWIGAWQPAANTGHDTRLKVRYGEEHNALVKFDLAGALPAGGDVQLATLSLYSSARSSANPLSIELHGLQAAWIEGEATYTNASAGAEWQVAGANGAADRDQAASDAVWAAWSNSWYTWGVTDLARAWAADPAANQGVLLRGAADVSAQYDFASSEYPELCRRPLLVVIYSAGAPLELAQ